MDFDTFFLGAFVLALLSIYTIQRCHQDTTAHLRDPRRLLFEGSSLSRGLASNLGAVFSVTYFFGATFIYARHYKGAFLAILTVIFATLFLLLPWLISQLHGRTPKAAYDPASSNLLLDFLSCNLPRSDFLRVLRLYLVLYFGLLVEELAVSRLVLATLFPSQPGAATLFLVTICFTILAYLAFGGFRAVLISDFEQLKVIVPFALVLVFLIYRDSPEDGLHSPLALPQLADLHKAGLACLFGVAWFAASIDFFGRLNLTDVPRDALKEAQIRLTRVSLVILFSLLVIGGLFGQHLAHTIEGVASPSSYTSSAMTYFFASGSRVSAVIFFVSVFVMIFTTLNTLLLTVLQLGWYLSSNFLSRVQLPRILLAAVILSTAIPFDAVSAVGVFIGSLVLLPSFALLHAFGAIPRALHVTSLKYLTSAAVLAVATFAVCYSDLETRFDRHFLIPGVVLVSTIFALALAKLWRVVRKLRPS